MEFYKEFKWAVPKAFKEALSICSFEEGDILYNTKDAYNNSWEQAKNQITYAFQIRSPARSKGKKTDENSSSIFKANWNSTIELEVLFDKDKKFKEKVIYSNQGRFFTLLHKGDISILNKEIEQPKIPKLVDDLKKQTDNQQVIDLAKEHFSKDMKNVNLFVMAYDDTNDLVISKFNVIYSSLQNFNPSVLNISLADAGLNADEFHPTLSFKCIGLDSTSPEKIRDKIKEIMWPKKDKKTATKSCLEIIERTKSVASNSFKLSTHGNFIPYITKKYKDIRTHSFNHEPVYRYRLHESKIQTIIDMPKSLNNFLQMVFNDCPNHLYKNNKFRVSKIDIDIEVNISHFDKHQLIDLAKNSRELTDFKSRHENLEKYFLDNDLGTIAVELPLWLEKGELKDFADYFGDHEVLTGHIDILRIEEDGKIAIWDYKPNAYKEKKAHVQTFLYAFMLSVRTGIKLSNFKCGYFDEIDLYQFNPSDVIFD